jgi:hypothetical protein
MKGGRNGEVFTRGKADPSGGRYAMVVIPVSFAGERETVSGEM